ncbi:hypothetical protein FKM82_023232 [Ascaphus truei]
MRFTENEMVPLLCAWVYATMGMLPYSKQDTERAKDECKEVFSLLSTRLRTCTFLVGERVSLADIITACALLWPYILVFQPSFHEPYSNVNRWFGTRVHLPEFVAVLGDITLCKEARQFKDLKMSPNFADP